MSTPDEAQHIAARASTESSLGAAEEPRRPDRQPADRAGLDRVQRPRPVSRPPAQGSPPTDRPAAPPAGRGGAGRIAEIEHGLSNACHLLRRVDLRLRVQPLGSEEQPPGTPWVVPADPGHPGPARCQCDRRPHRQGAPPQERRHRPPRRHHHRLPPHRRRPAHLLPVPPRARRTRLSRRPARRRQAAHVGSRPPGPRTCSPTWATSQSPSTSASTRSSKAARVVGCQDRRRD